MNTLSVISSSSWCGLEARGGERVGHQPLGSLSDENWCAETLTATRKWPGQAAASAQACRSAHSPSIADQVAVLGDRNEHAGADRSALGVVPAHQRLEPGDDVVGRADDRLVIHLQLAARERVAQVFLDLAPLRAPRSLRSFG